MSKKFQGTVLLLLGLTMHFSGQLFDAVTTEMKWSGGGIPEIIGISYLWFGGIVVAIAGIVLLILSKHEIREKEVR